jgi:hypothetical protein
MAFRYQSSLFRAALALALLLVLAACTPGGQFDPTEFFNSDMFDSKTKLTGPRQPLFPNGVPGTTTGVPADLVKGYQPPPDQADADANAPAPPVPAAQAAKPQEKPKPKLKPQVAVARPPKPPKVERPPASTPTRIDIGAKGAPAQQPVQANWPNSPSPAPAQQGGQFAWPSPQQAAQPSQSTWPAPPSTAPAQQAGQSSQSIWPNPPATGTSTQ